MPHTRLVAVAGAVLAALLAPPAAAGGPDGSWEEAVPVAGPGTHVFDVEVAVHRGHGLAVWVRSRDGRNQVQLARQHAGGRWTEPVAVVAARGAAEVEVAYDARGRARLVWTDGRRVETARLRADGSARRTVVLHRTPSGALGTFPAYLQLDVNDAGAAVVAWETMDDDADAIHSPPSVQAVARDSVGGWSDVETVSTPGVPALRPEVFVSRTGRDTVVWSEGSGRARSVHSATRPADEAWVGTGALTAPGVTAGVPQLAGLPSGRLAVAYSFRTGDRGGVAVQQRSRSLTWSSLVVLRGAGLRSRVDLALSPRRTTVAFTAARATVRVTTVARDGSGATTRLLPRVRVFSDLQVVANRGGDALVAWDTVRGGDHPVHAAYLGRDRGWGPVTMVSAPRGDAFLGGLGLSGRGGALVVWAAGELMQDRSWSVWSRVQTPNMG